jgi:hypothetical protein
MKKKLFQVIPLVTLARVVLTMFLLFGGTDFIRAQHMDVKKANAPAGQVLTSNKDVNGMIIETARGEISSSVSYTGDVIISNDSRNQSKPRLIVFANGTMLASYIDRQDSSLSFFRSTNNGSIWQRIARVSGNKFLDFDMVAVGVDTIALSCVGIGGGSSFRIIQKYTTLPSFTQLSFWAEFPPNISIETSTATSIATSKAFVGSGSSTSYSIAAVFSLRSTSLDSIIVVGSINDGTSWNFRTRVATTTGFFGRVSIGYGRSNASFGGRYIIAAEKINFSTGFGNILVSVIGASAFSIGGSVYVDSLFASTLGKVRRPSVAAQFTTMANDSADFTTQIAAEYQFSATNVDIYSFGHKKLGQASIRSGWFLGGISAPSSNQYQGKVRYNPQGNNFIATYWDSAAGQLSYKNTPSNTINNWSDVRLGFNDQTTGLIDPDPQIEINPATGTAAHVWIRQNGANGQMLFDAENRVSSVEGDKSLQPKEFSLAQNFPNPFNPSTVISYRLATAGDVRLEVFDVLGRKVQTLTNQKQAVGNYSVNFNAANLASGVYFYRLNAGAFTETRKMLLVK